MSRDLNDQLIAGELPADPEAGQTTMQADVPRVLTTDELLERSFNETHSKDRRPAACVTGHYRLDSIMQGGFRPGFVTLFGAETSWGKSSFLVSVVDENLQQNRRVLIVSAEDSESIYGDRLMARRGKISATRLRSGRLTREETAAALQVRERNVNHPVFIDGRGRSAEWLAKNTKQIIREHRIDVVAFDYLQAMGTDKRSQDRRNEVTWVARVLTDVVKSANISGIIFSQLTAPEGRGRPDRNCIRDSRDVANAAEVILLGWTPEKAQIGADDQVLVGAQQRCIIVDKNKDGPAKALVPMSWNEHSACFDAVRDPESERLQQLQDSVGWQGDN